MNAIQKGYNPMKPRSFMIPFLLKKIKAANNFFKIQIFICQKCTILWACMHIILCICCFRYGKDMQLTYAYQIVAIGDVEEQYLQYQVVIVKLLFTRLINKQKNQIKSREK